MDETTKKSQANAPGMRTLNLKIHETAFRRFRSEAEARGLTNVEFFLDLLGRPAIEAPNT
jgi:hypothetical protein